MFTDTLNTFKTKLLGQLEISLSYKVLKLIEKLFLCQIPGQLILNVYFTTKLFFVVHSIILLPNNIVY